MPRVRSAARQFVDPSEQPSHFRDFRLGVLPKAVLAEGAPALDVCTLSGAATFVGSSVGDTYLELQQGAQIALAFPELGERASVQSYTFTLDVRVDLTNELPVPLLAGLLALGPRGDLTAVAQVAHEIEQPPRSPGRDQPIARMLSSRWHRLVLSVAAERTPGNVSVYVDGKPAAEWRLTGELLSAWRFRPSEPVVIRAGRSDHSLQVRLFDVLPFALDAAAVLKREAFMKAFIEGVRAHQLASEPLSLAHDLAQSP